MITEAVILCGGQGTRLGLPGQKCLAPINGRPLLGYLVEQLVEAGMEQLVFATGKDAKSIESAMVGRWKPECVFSRESQPLGTGGALRLAAEKITGDRFLCLNGDSYVDYPLAQFCEWLDLVDPDAGVLLVPEQGAQTKYLGLPEEGRGNWVNGGVYGFKKQVVFDYFAWSVRDNTSCGIEEHMFPIWRAASCKLVGYQSNARWIDIGTPESLARAGEFFKQCSRPSSPTSPAETIAGQPAASGT